jgi:tetratricopeptide (TPR) repeat protein
MGWLDGWLGKDPAEELERAREWLAGGDPVRALQTARRLERSRDMAVRSQASSVLQQARDALVARTLENARAAEAAGDPLDAADWVRAALQHLGDGVQRAELEVRLETLERRIESTPSAPLVGGTGSEKPEPEAIEGFEGMELDLDTRYEMLVDMLTEEMARRYENPSPALREAVVDVNEGRAEAALARLDELVARNPASPVLHFERGRARLMLERWAGAREDFEAAWTRLGDEPVDRGGVLAVPLLWAEATLGQGDPGAVLDRLRELAAPEAGNPDLSALYTQALLESGRRDDARELMATLRELYPERQDFPHALAELLVAEEQRSTAIRILEVAVAPSCATGRCSRPPLHLPSLRLLTELYLEEKGPLSRIEELMVWISHAQGGTLAPRDHRLAARYHELTGDTRAAAEALRRADEAEREARRKVEHHPQVPGGDPSERHREMPI